MMDLTPLDVRKKAGDFRKGLRGYDPAEVDGFLQLVAERFEVLVRENLALQGKVDSMQQQIVQLSGRESAVQEALVVAQKIREDVKEQARREVDLLKQEGEAEQKRQAALAEARAGETKRAIAELEERRLRMLRGLRVFLQGELAALDTEEGRAREALADPPEHGG